MSQGNDHKGCTGMLWGLVLGVAVWAVIWSLGFLVVALILEIGGAE